MFLYPSQAYSAFEEKVVTCPYCNENIYLQSSNLEQDRNGDIYITGYVCCEEMDGALFYDSIYTPKMEPITVAEASFIVEDYLASSPLELIKFDNLIIKDRREGIFFENKDESNYFTFLVRKNKSFTGESIAIDLEAKHKEDMDFVLLQSYDLDEIWEELY